MRALVVRAALAAALSPAYVGAQTLSLTEAQVLAQLAAENPRVEAALAGVEAARADVLSAGRWPNPRVTYNRESVAGIAEDMFMVTQALPITGRRQLDVKAATARVEATSSRTDDRLRRLRADVRLAFSSLLAAQTRERELIASRDRLHELAEILGRRELAGEAAGFDRLRAEREVIDVDADRAIAAIDRARAQANLAAFLIPAAAAAAIEAVRPDEVRTPIPDLPQLVAQAESARGDLIAFTKELDAARLAEQAAGRRIIPEPELVAGTKSSNAGGGDVGSIVSVHVVVPLFDQSRPERVAAQARARQVRAEADVFRHALGVQIAAWRAAVIERREIADRYRKTVTTGANEIERISRVSYAAGESGILELLDAYRTASSARIRQAMLDAAVDEAEVELEFISGWEIS